MGPVCHHLPAIAKQEGLVVPQAKTRETAASAEEASTRGRQSIVRRLWRSFGLLLVILVVSGLVSGYLLLQIVGIVRQILQVEDPLERAALEMEINAGEATQALYNFVAEPLPQYVDRFRDSNEDFLRFDRQFVDLLAGSEQASLGQEIRDIHDRYVALGDEIMTTVVDRSSALRGLRNWVEQIDELLDSSLQRGLDTTSPEYTDKLHAALDMEINVDEAFGLIESYAHQSDPRMIAQIKDAVADFEHFEAQYRATQLSASEVGVLDQVVDNFTQAIAVGERVMALSDQLNQALASYRAELSAFDALIDDRVQQLVRERKADAHWDTERTSWIALIIIALMALIVLVIAGVTTWITTRKIVRSFITLNLGIDAFAKGDLDHKIRVGSSDELGRLGEALNQMVMQRRQATEALDEKNRLLEELSVKLSKYLSPQVYDSIFRGEKDVVISTARKKLTVLFADLKDFTATTDNLEPEELAALLNDYLTEMSAIALAYGATIDKYVGDAMLLFFGDPTTLGVREDALACVRMAIEMQARMAELRTKWRDLGQERPLHMRIGINTGYCNVGNFGSDERMDYTIIGGEVNLAARIEAATPVDGIMLAHETYALVRDYIAAQEQEPIEVKGFARPIQTYLVEHTLDEEAPERAYIHNDQEGVRVHIDLRKLDEQHRLETAQQLEAYARRLRESKESNA